MVHFITPLIHNNFIIDGRRLDSYQILKIGHESIFVDSECETVQHMLIPDGYRKISYTFRDQIHTYIFLPDSLSIEILNINDDTQPLAYVYSKYYTRTQVLKKWAAKGVNLNDGGEKLEASLDFWHSLPKEIRDNQCSAVEVRVTEKDSILGKPLTPGVYQFEHVQQMINIHNNTRADLKFRIHKDAEGIEEFESAVKYHFPLKGKLDIRVSPYMNYTIPKEHSGHKDVLLIGKLIERYIKEPETEVNDFLNPNKFKTVVKEDRITIATDVNQALALLDKGNTLTIMGSTLDRLEKVKDNEYTFKGYKDQAPTYLDKASVGELLPKYEWEINI